VWRALPWSLRYAAAVAGCSVLIVAAGYLLLRMAVLVAPLTLAVVVALLLTALLQPITEALCRRGAPRPVGALAGLLALLALLVVPGLLLWQAVVEQAGRLPEQLEQGWSRTRQWLVGAFGISDQQLDAAVDRGVEQFRAAARTDAAAYAMGALEALGAALLALVLVFFLLKDGPAMVRWFRGLLPAHSRDRWSDAAGDGWRALARYARGTVAVAAIDAVGIGAALLLIGVPLALPLALLTFVAAFVPVLGATVAGAVAALVALAAGGPVDALLVLAAVIAVQQLEGNLLEPLIMGRALRLHPAVVLVAVTAGALTGGVAGALVAMPVTAVAYQVTRTALAHRQRRENEQDPAAGDGSRGLVPDEPG
jgi:predicted PurR-regulated permease PerM